MCDINFRVNRAPSGEPEPERSRDEFFAELFGIQPEVLQARHEYITQAAAKAAREAEAVRQAELAAKAGQVALQTDAVLAEATATHIEEAAITEDPAENTYRPMGLAIPGHI